VRARDWPCKAGQVAQLRQGQLGEVNGTPGDGLEQPGVQEWLGTGTAVLGEQLGGQERLSRVRNSGGLAQEWLCWVSRCA
jgi:hypothetical protein